MSSLPDGDGVPGRRNIGDARGVEHRKLRRRTHFAGKIEMRCGTHAGDGDDAGQRCVRIDMATNDVQEIELPRVCQAPRDFDAFLLGKPLFEILVGDHADADDEIRADGALRTASMTAQVKRSRFSSEPP